MNGSYSIVERALIVSETLARAFDLVTDGVPVATAVELADRSGAAAAAGRVLATVSDHCDGRLDANPATLVGVAAWRLRQEANGQADALLISSL